MGQSHPGLGEVADPQGSVAENSKPNSVPKNLSATSASGEEGVNSPSSIASSRQQQRKQQRADKQQTFIQDRERSTPREATDAVRPPEEDAQTQVPQQQLSEQQQAAQREPLTSTPQMALTLSLSEQEQQLLQQLDSLRAKQQQQLAEQPPPRAQQQLPALTPSEFLILHQKSQEEALREMREAAEVREKDVQQQQRLAQQQQQQQQRPVQQQQQKSLATKEITLVGNRVAAAKTPDRSISALEEEEKGMRAEPAPTSSVLQKGAKTSVDGAGAQPQAAAQAASNEDFLRLTSVIEQMQKQLTESNLKLEKRVRSIETAERKEVDEYYHYPYEQRLLQAENDELRQEAKRQAAMPPSTPSLLDDPEYQSRFELLIRQGQYSMKEVHEALRETKQEGKFSSQRADAYLKKKKQEAEAETLVQANRSLGEHAIQPNSSLGRLLKVSANADAVDIIVKLKDVHARARQRTAHSATPALSAGNLVLTPVIKNDVAMGRKGFTFLSEVACAVSEDCKACSELRDQAEAQEKWKLQADKNAEDLKKSKSKAAAKQRVSLPFRISDSRRDPKIPRGHCGKCEGGWGAQGHYLYYCAECSKGYHAYCVDWKHIRLTSGGTTWFACNACIDKRDREIDDGDDDKEYLIVDSSDDGHGLAPQSAEAAGTPVPSEDAATKRDTAGGSAAQSAPPPPATPVRTSLNLVQNTPRTPYDSHTEDSILNSGSDRNKTTVGVNVKDYYVWEAEPPGWRAKPEGPKYHPDKGYSKAAYHNWRRKVVTQRDQVRAAGSSMGPLTRAIGMDIRSRVGAQFLKEPAIDQFKPRSNMTGKEIDAWVASDPEFKWFEKIPDEILLEILDRRFGVKTADHFLAKQFYTNLPMTDEHGDINYHSALFNQWATEWQNELMELQKAHVDFEAIDLKQVLLNALTPHPIVHKKAVSVAEDSYVVLLATLCDWVIREEERAEDAREQKNSLLKLGRGNTHDSYNAHDSYPPHPQNKNPPSPRAGGGAPTAQHGSKANATALLTQLASHLGVSSPATGGQAAPRHDPRPLPGHLKALGEGNNQKLFCRGCNNAWDRSIAVPCYKLCKYAEHPDYNKDCREREGVKKEALTWKRFRDRFPHVTAPQSLLAWEEKERLYAARTQQSRRPRDETRHGA
jgi:hypothetical protein